MNASSSKFALVDEDVDTRTRVRSLYRRHRDDVYRLALRYGQGDPAWAEDIVQDVFVTLCRKVDKLEDDADLGGWFYRVTHNRCLSRLRRRAVAQSPAVRWLLGRRGVSRDDRRVEHRTGLHEVFTFVDGLQPKQRLAFCMYHLDGMEQAEIGEVLGVSKSYVCKLIKRATTAVEKKWEEHDAQ
ncbi:MAG: sigma-70 family RNA polymerase sigma factor [Nannocystaceae bacterium]|nr:sigma-70 family RNA polymerase sigma factor [Nannocystaceae bacterium]